jgi:hypothetical protein
MDVVAFSEQCGVQFGNKTDRRVRSHISQRRVRVGPERIRVNVDNRSIGHEASLSYPPVSGFYATCRLVTQSGVYLDICRTQPGF